MIKKELQVENGNFTRIVNPLIEELVKIPFKGCELAVALFIIRKTYGFQKKQDEISITQFENGLKRSRPVIVKALKNLQLVKVVKLVKRGSSKTCSNLWEINKYYNEWELVKLPQLVKHRRSTSKDLTKQLVKAAKHTKENIQKKYTKEILQTNVCDTFNYNIQLKKMFEDKDIRMWTIATYWTFKGLKSSNKDQYSSRLKRELRPSGLLKGYDKRRIYEVMSWLATNSDFKWTLETVHKYIDEDLNKLATNNLSEKDKAKIEAERIRQKYENK